MNDTATPHRKPAPDDSSIKETLQSIIVAFILAFVFRAFVVEAFVIPTGSMAPTLLGQHVSFTCPQCGYRFTSGPRDNVFPDRQPVPLPIQGEQQLRNKNGQLVENLPPLVAHCPMCGYPVTIQRAPVNAGDRILVLKYIYAFSEPRRWDVVVFRNPKEPAVNYIKRLIGLPDEQLRIIRGNIYTSKDEGKTWHIQRKPARVQNAVWQPAYHSDRVPLDDGDSVQRTEKWTNPWQPADPSDWHTAHRGRTFEFTPPAGPTAAAGVLNFDFAHHPNDAKDYYAYNELPGNQPLMPHYHRPPTTTLIEDLRAGVTLLTQKPGASVQLSIDTELFNYQGMVNADGSAQIRMKSTGVVDATSRADDDDDTPPGKSDWITVAQTPGSPLDVDHPHRIELWCVDQSVQLWIDGQVAARYDIPVAEHASEQSPFVLSVAHLLAHNDVSAAPRVSVTVSGAPMHLSDIDLDRDLYYTNTTQANSLATYDNVAKLKDDEFFCLGDNSPESLDGRLWDGVDPWVTYHTRNGHTHIGPDGKVMTGVGQGIVPRQLMIGRAFFVYWPAPYHLSTTSWLPVPNFGDMRFIH